jgi:hypothetical protein
VLADPRFYDGKRIIITAWGVSGGGEVVVFPSEDSMLAVEANASIVLSSGEGISEVENLLNGKEYGAGRLVIGGVFHLRGGKAAHSGRLGSISEVELMRR